MPRGGIGKDERLALLRGRLKEKGELRSSAYADMARRLRISTAQLRRDLKQLEEAGLVRYRYGYTEHVPTAERLRVDAIDPRSGFGEALDLNWEDKVAVGERLAEVLLTGGDPATQTLYIGAGTTMYAFTLALVRSRRHAHIYTGSLPAAFAASQAPTLTVSVIGGMVNHLSLRTEGEEYERVSRQRFDLGAFSCMAMSSEGMFADVVHDPALRRRLMSSCRGVLVGITGSKLAEHSSGQFITSFENLAKETEWIRVLTTPPRSAEGERALESIQQKLSKLFRHVTNPLVVIGA